MKRTRVLALVLAGGQGQRMEVLTHLRAKPALAFAGVYRLIDLALSNLRNSGLSDVWLVVQYETQSITDIVGGGRPWDMDRSRGGLKIVPPQQDHDHESRWHQGNADALYQLRSEIREAAPDVLLAMSADHVYRLDLRDVVEQHVTSGAGVTLVSTTVPLAQASSHATVTVDDDGLVTSFVYKPDKPESRTVATEVFAYDPVLVLDTLDELAAEVKSTGGRLEDFGHELLPALVARGSVRNFKMPAYWKDVGRPDTYFAAHMDLLAGNGIQLDDPEWPIFTMDAPRMPARIAEGAKISESLISPGCRIEGTVQRSVLGPGVVVEPGAVVRDSVLLNDVSVRTGAQVQRAIVDGHATIGKDAKVGQRGQDLPTTEQLVLIGMGARVRGGAVIKAGERLRPRPSNLPRRGRSHHGTF